MHSIVALAIPRVVAFDLAIVGEVFGHAELAGHYRFTVCSGEPSGAVPTTTGYVVQGLERLDRVTGADTVLVPGYAPHADPPDGVLQALRGAAERGARVVSICTGAFALAAAGLLDGRRATTHWQDAAELAARFPAVRVDADALYVEDGQVATSAGVAAGIDLCLHLVRRDLGAGPAARVAQHMVVASHRDGGQAQFVQRPVPPMGAGLHPTCAWAMSRLHERLTVAEMARHAGWAPRTFARRFIAETGTTPARWLTTQRLLEARRLLEETELPIEQVADHCGLGTAANLRLHFARDARMAPTAYRRAHRRGGESVAPAS